MGSRISRIEYVTGETPIFNEELSQKYTEYDFNKFERFVGIKKRFRVGPKESSLTLAVAAVNKLIHNFPEVQSQIDFLILCTQSPENPLPTTACLVQDKCNLNKNIGALDINLGCSGFTYSLSVAHSLISSKTAKKVLIVTAETYSRYIHDQDLINQLIFSDAASATLVEYCNEERIGKSVFGTDGSGSENLIVRNNFFTKNPNAETKTYSKKNLYTDNHLYMNGSEVYNFTLERIPKLLREIISLNNLEIDEIDKVILHQANKFLIKSVLQKAEIDQLKNYNYIENIGNTVSSTIPIALKEYIENRKRKTTETILLAGFGVGLSWSGLTINL